MPTLLLWLVPRLPGLASSRRLVLAAVAVVAVGASTPRAEQAAEDPSRGPAGVAMVPPDAAFLSSSLRIREQYDALVASNAFKALMDLPAVKRALESYEEQRITPGSAFSTFEAFLSLPENEAAADLLADMVATDTFVYGEPSCVPFWTLVRQVRAAQQRGQFSAGEDVPGRLPHVDGDDVLGFAGGAGIDAGRQARLVLEALADNLDGSVVPDVVWGFETTKRDVAVTQIARLEALGQGLLQGDATYALGRTQVAGGDVLTFTVDGGRLPWGEVEREIAAAAGDEQRAEQVFDRLRDLDLVVAIGVVDDWVIVSIGDSVDHLGKLAVPGSGRPGLLDAPPLAPLRADAGKRITAVSYLSQPLVEAVGNEQAGVETLLAAVDQVESGEELSPEAVADIRGLAARAAGEYEKWLPKPGPWMAYSFRTDQGYEGYAWNWGGNQPFDGDSRLDVLEHVGGAPLAVLVWRMRSDPEAFDALIGLGSAAWELVVRHGRPGADVEDRRSFDSFAEHLAPYGGRLATTLRGKILASLADGQVGLVIDAKGRTKALQGDLPASADPLPIAEPAIVLPLADPKLFKEGLSDLFALADEFTASMRDLDPDAVPQGYRIPEPERAKVEEGSVWSWPLSATGLDEQIKPAVGVGGQAAVFTLVPKQAGRTLAESKLETGAQLATFDEPLAGAAAIDVAGLLDAIRPWLIYMVRYWCVQNKEGFVDPQGELSAADETEPAKEIIEHGNVVIEALKSLRVAVAETSFRDGALVTRWQNVIRDMPAN
ncbi:MAG: hypothetical protein ACKON8_10970 [Planctomycetota bacterium]